MGGAVSVGGEDHFSPRSIQLKPTIKVQISGRMASIGISFGILRQNPYEEVDDENDNN